MSAPVTTIAGALKKGHFHLIRPLLDKGCDPNEKDEEKRTPLMICSAIQEKQWAICIARMLLEKEARISNTDAYGKNALMISCIDGRLELVKLFLNALDCKLNATDRYGHTALAMCAMHGEINEAVEIISKLRQWDQTINVPNRKGITPSEIAFTLGYPECGDYIFQQSEKQKLERRERAEQMKLREALEAAAREEHYKASIKEMENSLLERRESVLEDFTIEHCEHHENKENINVENTTAVDEVDNPAKSFSFSKLSESNISRNLSESLRHVRQQELNAKRTEYRKVTNAVQNRKYINESKISKEYRLKKPLYSPRRNVFNERPQTAIPKCQNSPREIQRPKTARRKSGISMFTENFSSTIECSFNEEPSRLTEDKETLTIEIRTGEELMGDIFTLYREQLTESFRNSVSVIQAIELANAPPPKPEDETRVASARNTPTSPARELRAKDSPDGGVKHKKKKKPSKKTNAIH